MVFLCLVRVSKGYFPGSPEIRVHKCCAVTAAFLLGAAIAVAMVHQGFLCL